MPMSNLPCVSSYRRHRPDGRYDAIVIGSGIGGLGAAALLAKYGRRRVLVLERHYTPGGYTHVFHRPGYEWDVGVHYRGDLAPGAGARRVFDAVTDGTLEWASLGDVYDRIVLGDRTYELRTGVANLRRHLHASFPREVAAIDRYFALVEQAVAASRNYFMAKALPAGVAAILGPVLRRPFLRLAARTTRSVLEELTADQQLIAVLTGQWGDFGLPPAQSSFGVHAMVANHYFNGAYYPVGGAGRIAAAIAPLIAAAGGAIFVNAEVAEIVVERGRATGVRMADDAVLEAPIIISDAGALSTFGRLLPAAVAERYRLLPNPQTCRPSIAHVCLYIGLKHTAEELGLPKANLWIYPDEQHERTFARMLAEPGSPQAAYISFPSAKDPDFTRRHPGRATIDVIALCPYESVARWTETRWKKRPEAYRAFKEHLTERLLALVYRQVPQIQGKVDTYELSTPLTTRHFANYAFGELYGLDHTPARFRERLLRPRTPLPGLFLTGQDIATCGVVGALMGAVLSASTVLRRDLLRRIMQSPRSQSESRMTAATA